MNQQTNNSSDSIQQTKPVNKTNLLTKIFGLPIWLTKVLLILLIGLTVLLTGLWASFAIYFSNLPFPWMRTGLAWAFGVGFLLAFALLRKRRRTLLIYCIAYAVVLIWWQTIPASHDRNWNTSVAKLPYAEVTDNIVTLHNIRNFDYRTEEDFTPRYYDATYNLDDLQTMDFGVSYWDNNTAVGHTMLSFGFADGRYVTVGIETRTEKEEPQSGLRGFFKQYEVIFIWADERDYMRLRTNFRGEQLYLYPTTSTPEQVRIVFLDLIRRTNDIYKHPEFYNTITHNCTTALAPSVRLVRPPRDRFDIRILKNGYADQASYESGWLKSDLPFDQYKKQRHVNQYVKDLTDSDQYSKLIRPYLK